MSASMPWKGAAPVGHACHLVAPACTQQTMRAVRQATAAPVGRPCDQEHCCVGALLASAQNATANLAQQRDPGGQAGRNRSGQRLGTIMGSHPTCCCCIDCGCLLFGHSVRCVPTLPLPLQRLCLGSGTAVSTAAVETGDSSPPPPSRVPRSLLYRLLPDGLSLLLLRSMHCELYIQ